MKIKRSTINAVIFLIGLVLVYWNIKLGLALERLKKHPDKIEILLRPDDSITQQVKAIEDSLKVSIIVPEYENDELNQSISTLSAIAEMLGQVLAALAVFMSILIAFGIFEVNSWRTVRKGIEEGEEKVKGLSASVNDKILQIEKSKESFEQNIRDLESLGKDLNENIIFLNSKHVDAQKKIEELIIEFNQKQGELTTNNRHFSEFKNSILNHFHSFREEIRPTFEDDLKRVKDANFNEHQYPVALKEKLKDYFQIYRIFGAFLEAIQLETPTLEDIDYFALGMAALFEQKNHDSVILFKKAVEVNPNDHISYFKLGSIYFLLDSFVEAAYWLEFATTIEPRFSAAHFNKGRAYNELREYAKAIKAYEEVIQINPDFIPVYIALSVSKFLNNELDSANSILDFILSKDEKNSTAYYNKACICSVKKNRAEALFFLEKAFTFDPEGILKGQARKDPNFEWLVDSEDFKFLLK